MKSAHAHSPEDGSEMLAEKSGTIILFSFKTQCVERQLFLSLNMLNEKMDHRMNQGNVVFIHRFNNMESIPWGPIQCGLYKQVVFIYRWSLQQV